MPCCDPRSARSRGSRGRMRPSTPPSHTSPPTPLGPPLLGVRRARDERALPRQQEQHAAVLGLGHQHAHGG
eukprot:193391-Chlamydomonas_euryale.AAC.1